MSTEKASSNEQQVSLVEERLQAVAASDGKKGAAGDHRDSAMPDAALSSPESAGTIAQERVIWTPAFILAFGFMLVGALSLESLLTQGWLNGFYTGQWVFQGHVMLAGIGWLALLLLARASWVRIGAIFGLAWAAFMTIDILVQVTLGSDPVDILALLAHINVLICLSLLGCSICLTIDRFHLRPWDAWVLGLLPLVGVVATAAWFLLSHDHTLFVLEGIIASVSLVLSGVVWLARPSCWREAPMLTVLFGLVPVILLGLDKVNGGYNGVNFFLSRVVLSSHNNVPLREANFFFSQVALLCLILGIMRLIKCELAN